MTDIEFVMEILGILSEVVHDISMERKSGFDDGASLVKDGHLELVVTEMLRQVGRINNIQRSLFWETYSKKPEMSLQTWVDYE